MISLFKLLLIEYLNLKMYYDINLKKAKNTCFTIIIIIMLALCVNIVLYIGLACV